MRRLCLLLSSLCLTGCFATKVVGPPVPMIPDRVPAVTVVIEPLFENADWRITTKSETATVYGGPGMGGGFGGGFGGPPQTVVVDRQVAEKPVFARVPVLIQEHQ